MTPQGEDSPEETAGVKPAGYAWAMCGVASATALFWLARGYLDKDHASLLYMPVSAAHPCENACRIKIRPTACNPDWAAFAAFACPKASAC